MMSRHSGERGIGLDHWCALVSKGNGMYSVISNGEKEGSVLEDGSHSEERAGSPGLWILDSDADGKITRRLAPTSGSISDLLRAATTIKEDPRCLAVLEKNPPVLV